MQHWESIRQVPLRRKRRRRALLALTASALLLATACGGGDESSKGPGTTAPPSARTGNPLDPQPLAERQKVTAAISSRLEAYAPLLLADHFGEFEKENLDVDIKFVSTGESTLLAAQGKIDIVSQSFSAGSYNTIAKGSGLRFVFPTVHQAAESTVGYWANKEVLNPDGGELTAGDFKGKKILTASGEASPSAFAMYEYVKQLPGGDKITPKDLQFEKFDPTTTAQAIKSGAAAAGQVNSPYDQQLVDQSCCEYLKGAFPERTSSAYIFGPSMEKRADAGAAFVRAMARTIHSHLAEGYRDNDETMKGLAEVLEQDIKVLEGLEELYWDPEFPVHPEENLKAQPFFRARGLLQYDKDLTPADIYDPSYLEAIGVTS